LADGDQLAATRALAAQLEISRAVVVAAYEELTASGFLVAKQGSSTRVEAGAQRAALAGAFATVGQAGPIGVLTRIRARHCQPVNRRASPAAVVEASPGTAASCCPAASAR
jgi:DNA-binding FadR family transcriptional regulator